MVEPVEEGDGLNGLAQTHLIGKDYRVSPEKEIYTYKLIDSHIHINVIHVYSSILNLKNIQRGNVGAGPGRHVAKSVFPPPHHSLAPGAGQPVDTI